MPQYSDMIRIEGEYNYSANIQFDMESDRKLLRFISNETTIELLKEYFIDITRSNPNNHARILYGSYGTGKSHFLTVIGMLLGKVYTNGLAYKSFLSRVAAYDKDLAADIDSYISNKERKPMLVVPIVFDFDDFDRCIYFSLKKKLELVGKKVSFKTFFDQALSLINTWESNEESCNRLVESCKKLNVDLDCLKRALSSLEKSAEGIFQSVFSDMTYGVKYIYEVSNLWENIKQANAEIADQYSGILFIFDEFGRYIEDNIRTIKVKSVQDMAEFCDHDGGNNHIILVSHKEISQYTQKFGKALSNEWKKVEGRYKATPINDKQDQCLSLIKNILSKDENLWNIFRRTHEKELNRIYSEAYDFKGFLLDAAQGENPFEGGFPLHPISLYALDKLSKRVAQNERTFFTYLASKDDNSLYRFLNGNDIDEFHFVGIDQIYDYFEPNIKSTQSDASYSWYKALQTALSKCRSSADDDSPEAKILKVIATIGIINDATTLISNRSTILSVVDLPNAIVSNAIDGLCENKILKYSGAYDRFDFFEASIFDVDEMISEGSQSVSDEAIIGTLNDDFVSFALYPYRYNQLYKISRVFIPVYANAQELRKKTFLNRFGKYYDGLLVMLLPNQELNIKDIEELSKEVPRSIILANMDADELKSMVRNYIAVKFLESQKGKYTEKDPAFEKELAYFKEEFYVAIQNEIQRWISKFEETSVVAVNGEKVEGAFSISDLSELATNLMLRFYPDTLIVNNELINKNSISGSMTTSRKAVIGNIIKGAKPDNYYDAQFLSPDYILVRSVLTKNGFIHGSEDDFSDKQNALVSGEKPQEKVKELLEKFISKGKTETVSFDEIVSALREPPFGLRNGYMSLLIAHFLIPYRKSLIINSHGNEQEISIELFEEIARRPHDYTFTIADWSKEQIDYLEALQHVFDDYLVSASLSKNRLKAIYDAMLSHYRNVSKFARTTNKYVAKSTLAYRKLIEKNITNYSEFLFGKLKSFGNDYETVVKSVISIRADLDDATTKLARDITGSICKMLYATDDVPLCKLLMQHYQDSWKKKRVKSFDYYTNSFLDFVEKLDGDEKDYELILKLSKAITGFEILYWNDSHKDEFEHQIKEIIEKLDAYKESSVLGEKETKVVLTSSDGVEKSMVFDRSELGTLENTVMNKIRSTFDNYGLSITYEDKLQILLTLLDDYMKGR